MTYKGIVTPLQLPGNTLKPDAPDPPHEHLTEIEKLRLRNANLQRALTQALERPCPACGRKPGEGVR